MKCLCQMKITQLIIKLRSDTFHVPIMKAALSSFSKKIQTFFFERIKSLSTLIDNQVQKLSEKIGQLGEARMILLASLVLLDKSDEVEKGAQSCPPP